MTTVALDADGQAIALLCSMLGLADARTVKPLGAGEWHALTLTMRDAGLSPQDLLGRAAADLRSVMDLQSAMADRLAALLSRGGQLALELERLAGQGIWVLTRADESYPVLIKRRLRAQAPPVLFGAGSQSCFDCAALAVVGSRDVDDDGMAYAEAVGRSCARAHIAVVSGVARGVDSAAMGGALEAGGTAIGITVDPLERMVRRRDLREPLMDGALVLVTPFHPSARWLASNAMRRNRLIYATARAAIVVASSQVKGGTRAGAVENLRHAWVPLYVRDDGRAGNSRLIAEGGIPLAAGSEDGVDIAWMVDGAAAAATRDGGPRDEATSPPVAPRPPDHQPSVPLIDDAPDEPAATNGDVFAYVWPWLEGFLREPRTERDVASRFGLELTQARAWLRRGVAEGTLDVEARPKRYVVCGGSQERLFSPDPP